MLAVDLVRQWEELGELDAEFTSFSTILSTKKYTRGQLMQCFDMILAPLCMALKRDLGRDPTIDEFRQKFYLFCADTVRLEEICMQSLYNSGRPDSEVLKDTARKLLNRIWQENKE